MSRRVWDESRLNEIGDEPVKIANMMATTNYGMFRFLEGNRDTDHVKRVRESIIDVGMLYCPILVNERFEIIDGQHRFSALKELGKPVFYVMQNGLGINEVRAMNTVSKNWDGKDHIHSRAHGADTQMAFIYLENLLIEFDGRVTAKTIYKACGYSKLRKEDLAKGNFTLSEDEYYLARKKLIWLSDMAKAVRSVPGYKEALFQALLFAYDVECVDNDVMRKKINDGYSRINPIVNVKQAIHEIQFIYNENQRANKRVRLENEYADYVYRTTGKI